MYKFLFVFISVTVVAMYTEIVTSIDSELPPNSREDDGSSEESGKDEDDDEEPPYPPKPSPTMETTSDTTESAPTSATRKTTQNPNNANSVRTTNTTKAIVSTTEAPSIKTTLNTGYPDQPTETTPFPVGRFLALIRSKFG